MINRNIFSAVLLAVLCATIHAAAISTNLEPRAPAITVGKPFQEWSAAVRKLPGNRELGRRAPDKQLLPLKTFGEFNLVLSAFLDHSRTGLLSQSGVWVGPIPEPHFFDTSRAYFQQAPSGPKFRPFAQKLSVPVGSQVFFHGDFHGDVQSFITALEWLNEQKYLDGFRIVPPNFYMVFLGDYTDRGFFGVEVLYTLMQLKLANPDRVFMSRGNHEDVSLLARYGFLHEGRYKYGAEFDIAKIARGYDFLPVVIYLETGNNVLQCNHGGMEPGYKPGALLDAVEPLRFQLLGKLNQKDFLAHHPHWPGGAKTERDLAMRAFQNHEPEDPVSPTVLGFMWNDFTVNANEPQFALDPDRAFIFGQQATRAILRSVSTTNRTVQAVFRAHQHSGILNPIMRRLVASSGLFRHWQEKDNPALLNSPPEQLATVLDKAESRSIPPGSVWTFNVAPDSVYGEGCKFTFDTFGIVTTAGKFDDWRVRVVNTPPRR